MLQLEILQRGENVPVGCNLHAFLGALSRKGEWRRGNKERRWGNTLALGPGVLAQIRAFKVNRQWWAHGKPEDKLWGHFPECELPET